MGLPRKPLTHLAIVFYVQFLPMKLPVALNLLSGVAGSGRSMPEILKIFGGSEWWTFFLQGDEPSVIDTSSH